MSFVFRAVMYIKCVKISFIWEHRPPVVKVKNTVCMWTTRCSYTFMNRQCIHARHGLYLDAEGSGLWAGGLSGGGGLCGGLEQSFEDGLGVHLWSGLRGGSLASGTRQGRGQTVFFWSTACARSITQPPVEVNREGDVIMQKSLTFQNVIKAHCEWSIGVVSNPLNNLQNTWIPIQIRPWISPAWKVTARIFEGNHLKI